LLSGLYLFLNSSKLGFLDTIFLFAHYFTKDYFPKDYFPKDYFPKDKITCDYLSYEKGMFGVDKKCVYFLGEFI
jgi:hypothetical protein